MAPQINDLWVYLSTTPLLGLTVTLLAYQAAWWVHRRSGSSPLANPVMIAVAALVALLAISGTSYQTYFDGAQFVHFLLGPATVALAVPLYTQFRRVRAMMLPVIAGLLVGSFTAAVSAVLVARLFGASLVTQLSLAPKSVTTPIAMGVAERIGGIPSLTAVLVISTGILGAVLGRYLFDALRIDDAAIRGFATGVTAHGIGTARAFQESEQAGAFAALAMGMNGLVTALLLPMFLPLLQ
ncbi:MAG: LrgB family protein [Candidatus Accumulibacter sp.]|uniref:LrgB family protein n=1 Tax=Candidatus Accumulibacter TaxID=327159 RepID=UPI001ACC0073|nr:LrgB family protein [Accumulibacter sp.]MBK8116762.1 LrgB family protein [Accumulibacter sp.]MBK8576944.1 LrgB family protein [Candidatus Accumulibacter propinquus]MBN8437457.1 LrgB family protein [Accumulibacter sp.]